MELKPCPFCGCTTVKFISDVEQDSAGRDYEFVTCCNPECLSEGPIASKWDDGFFFPEVAKEKAAGKWNLARRHSKR